MLYAIMIFITEVWSGLCKPTTYQLLNLKEFWPNSTWPYFSIYDSGEHLHISGFNIIIIIIYNSFDQFFVKFNIKIIVHLLLLLNDSFMGNSTQT